MSSSWSRLRPCLWLGSSATAIFGQFWGVAAPPGTDPAIAAWWADKFKKVVETKAWQDGLKEKFQRSEFYALAAAGDYFRKEQATFRALISD